MTAVKALYLLLCGYEIVPRGLSLRGYGDRFVIAVPISAYLLDTSVPGMDGGTGRSFDWRIARDAEKIGRIVLSGGLRPENVAEAIRTARPYAVDVSSGVENSPGSKSVEKINRFVEAVRSADNEFNTKGGN